MLALDNVAAAYSPGCDPSTIGAAGLNFSVRDGKRWGPCARPPSLSVPSTGYHVPCMACYSPLSGKMSWVLDPVSQVFCLLSHQDMPFRICGGPADASFRAISTARLCHRWLYTCGLSTSSSPTALCGSPISEGVSHLDAFSAYPFPTWLPGGAVGTTAGTPAVGPTRSSRTKVGAPQTSHARNR